VSGITDDGIAASGRGTEIFPKGAGKVSGDVARSLKARFAAIKASAWAVTGKSEMAGLLRTLKSMVRCRVFAGAYRAYDGAFQKAAAYIRMPQGMTATALPDDRERVETFRFHHLAEKGWGLAEHPRDAGPVFIDKCEGNRGMGFFLRNDSRKPSRGRDTKNVLVCKVTSQFLSQLG